ncbi:MerR family transcriptional regulator [Candidatus Dependentiae bacterium]|nr:MAG: MerR family transcriptional regulator [Candidatus Dependentiae bacterium]
MKLNRKKGYFSISAVAKMFSVHQQTVRLYEREGLINPKRSSGNTRLFSEEDVDRLEEVIYLTHELGINLAGVEMILKLKKQLKKMQDEMNKLFESTKDDLDKERILAETIAHKSAKKISLLKTNALKDSNLIKQPNDTHQKQDEPDTWEIDYEE